MPGSSSSISFATLWILQKTLAVDLDIVDVVNVVKEGVVAGLEGAGANEEEAITILDMEKLKNNSSFTAACQSESGVLSRPMKE